MMIYVIYIYINLIYFNILNDIN